jgi:hypothetical protein
MAASAQEVDAGHYDGSWTARLPCRSGQGTCAARLSIADFAGTPAGLYILSHSVTPAPAIR